jgi:hypothetical protein
MKRLVFLLLVLPFVAAFASEIREFDLKTTAQLGRELNRVSQRPDKGATNGCPKAGKTDRDRRSQKSTFQNPL